MPKVGIITDSTAYIPPDLILRHGIRVVPLSLLWDGSSYRDGIDIMPEAFYSRLKTCKTMPSTSQVTPDEFKRTFSQILNTGSSVLCILISGSLSGTVESAQMAKAEFGNAPIEIIDSRFSAMALGFTTLAAARAIAGGAGLEEAVAAARKAITCSGVFFVVDTLEFLHRGGRIGGAKRFVGTALNLKPILTLHDGKVEAIESVRTKGKATERMLDLVAERLGNNRPIRLSPLHAASEDEAKNLMAVAQRRFYPDECFISEVSPVIGTHVGPGTIGMAYCAGI